MNQPDPDDTTPAALTFGSLGLRHDVSVPQDAKETSLRLRATDSIQILAQATDEESGLAEVAIRGHIQVACYPADGTKEIVLREPIDQTRTRKDTSSFPKKLATAFPLKGGEQRSRCPAGSRFGEMTGSLTASATSTSGVISQLGPLSIRSFGPDVVRVATFNLYRPGNHADSVYVAWGTYLRDKADVLLLTEVEDRRRAELIAQAAGMPNVVLKQDRDSDLAILSRGPIRHVHRYTVDPPNSRLDSAQSNLMVAETDLGNHPHQVAVAHLAIRDANDELFEPWRSAPGRLEAAQRIIAEIDRRSSNDPVIVGGDFNAYSGLGPQERPGATAEVSALRHRFTDPLTVLNVPDTDLCGVRIDYILLSGYAPTSYKQDCTANEPSDHPMVLAVLEAN
ncbi:endonuclease/exonuclease/phosphatase family protein [Streptomyces nigra]|uniref:endonuclease/exonuclease/phosphatase family protein n=1 Tax=Streptomyces nigra TaxID=1827580 RepID=UPI00365F7441